ncbi:hypothetical protein VUR80DRAFT_219 [Thermomyces stellatus]
MKAVPVVLSAFVSGVMALSTAFCPESVATCDVAASATPTEDHLHPDETGNDNRDDHGPGSATPLSRPRAAGSATTWVITGTARDRRRRRNPMQRIGLGFAWWLLGQPSWSLVCKQR